jgi:hypothetical protein
LPVSRKGRSGAIARRNHPESEALNHGVHRAASTAKVAFLRTMPKNAERVETQVEGTDVIVELP